jgi:hypothetical protein
MNIHVEIKSDITPENIEAKVREQAERFAADKIRSMLLAQRLAPVHSSCIAPGARLKGLSTLHAYGTLAKGAKAVWTGGSNFPRTSAHEGIQGLADIRLRAFLKR